MSDTEHNGSAVGRDESIGGMTSADVKFLVTCLKNTTGGSIAVSSDTQLQLLLIYFTSLFSSNTSGAHKVLDPTTFDSFGIS